MPPVPRASTAVEGHHEDRSGPRGPVALVLQRMPWPLGAHFRTKDEVYPWDTKRTGPHRVGASSRTVVSAPERRARSTSMTTGATASARACTPATSAVDSRETRSPRLDAGGFCVSGLGPPCLAYVLTDFLAPLRRALLLLLRPPGGGRATGLLEPLLWHRDTRPRLRSRTRSGHTGWPLLRRRRKSSGLRPSGRAGPIRACGRCPRPPRAAYPSPWLPFQVLPHAGQGQRRLAGTGSCADGSCRQEPAHASQPERWPEHAQALECRGQGRAPPPGDGGGALIPAGQPGAWGSAVEA